LIFFLLNELVKLVQILFKKGIYKKEDLKVNTNR